MSVQTAQDVAADAKAKIQDHLEEMKTTASDLRADLAQLKKEVSSLVGSLIGTGKDGAGVARQKLADTAAVARDRLGQSTERIGEAWKSAKDCSADAVKSVEDKIAANPLAALAIAVGVGLIVGAIMRRR